MHIVIHSYVKNVPLTISNELVHEFIKLNPNILGESSVDSAIKELSKKILEKYGNSIQYKADICELDISLNILPNAMQKWAATIPIFNIETVRMETDDSTVEKTKLIPYSYANTDWSDVEVVMIAKEGQRGAWFFSNSERGSVVVKGQEGAEAQLMGTVFLLMMGMNAPGAKLVYCNSTEGKQISSLGQSAGLNNRSPSHYIVMDRVMGPTFTNLSSNDIEIVKKNLNLFGELAVYDLVLGNFDRFQLDSTSFNSGNIMFQNNILHAIDTDCIFDEEREGFTKLALRKIIENRSDASLKIVQKLSKHLGDGVDPDHFSTEEIAKGFKIAIEKLLNIARNLDNTKVLFIDNCADRGVINTTFPQHVENYLYHIFKSSQ